jgi:hypothetical protein
MAVQTPDDKTKTTGCVDATKGGALYACTDCTSPGAALRQAASLALCIKCTADGNIKINVSVDMPMPQDVDGHQLSEPSSL